MDALLAWLGTPVGIEVAHTVAVLLTAIAATLSAVAARIAHRNSHLLNGHIRDHLYGSGDREELQRHLKPPPGS